MAIRTIIAVVDDLFFASKIRGTAEQAGVPVQFVKSIADVVEKAKATPPELIIADLNAQCCDVSELARALKRDDALKSIPLLGFFSHVQTEVQQAAIRAGFDQVIPRSAFSKNLPQILAGSVAS